MSGKEQGCNSGVEILIGFQKVKKWRKIVKQNWAGKENHCHVRWLVDHIKKNRGKYLVGVFDQKNAQ